MNVIIKNVLYEKDPNAMELQNLSQLNYDDLSIQPIGATSFGKCVVNKVLSSYGNVARQFLNGSILIYIKYKQYDLTARLMFKTLVKAEYKVNAVGLAAVLGYGWRCRGAR